MAFQCCARGVPTITQWLRWREICRPIRASRFLRLRAVFLSTLAHFPFYCGFVGVRALSSYHESEQWVKRGEMGLQEGRFGYANSADVGKQMRRCEFWRGKVQNLELDAEFNLLGSVRWSLIFNVFKIHFGLSIMKIKILIESVSFQYKIQ
jgi:hypothetical protein